jgi:TonB family protein
LGVRPAQARFVTAGVQGTWLRALNERPTVLTIRSRAVCVTTFLAASALATGIGASSEMSPPQEKHTGLSGVVLDQLQGLVPRAEVRLLDSEGKRRASGRSDKTGRFQLSTIPNGEYTLEVSIPGFKVAREKLLLSGASMRHDVRLEIGGIEETVVVRTGDLDRRGWQAAGRAEPRCEESFKPGEVGGRVRPPRKVRHVRPVYPAAQKVAGAEERVVVEGKLGTDGSLKDLRVVSVNHDDFAAAALAAVAEWRFTVMQLNCQPVEAHAIVRFDFVR